MRKLLAVILATIMSISMLTGCGNDNSVEEVESVVTSFMTDFTSANFDNLLNYVADDAKDELTPIISDYQGLANSLLDAMPGIALEDSVLDGLMNSIFSRMSYEVNGIEVDGDEATVSLTMMTPDFESLDTNQILMDVLGVTDESELLGKILESAGLDMTALMTVTEDQINEIMGSFVADLIVSLTDYLNNNADVIQTVPEETTIELTKVEGEWKISSLD